MGSIARGMILPQKCDNMYAHEVVESDGCGCMSSSWHCGGEGVAGKVEWVLERKNIAWGAG